MSQCIAMKLTGARNMGLKVEVMEWNDKRDLIAIGNEKGEVLIQRLNWQKVVTLPAPCDNIKVRHFSWHPDEPVIAIVYSNGKVSLLDVEKEDEIHSFTYPSDIKTLHWNKVSRAIEHVESANNKTQLSHENFLPSLPNLSTFSSSAKKFDSNNFFTNGSPCFLIIGLYSGKVCLIVYGILACGTIEIQDHIKNPENFEIFDVRLSLSSDEIFVFLRDGDVLKVLIFKNDVLSNYLLPLLNLATKHGHVMQSQIYLSETLDCIIESWETVLLEMDNKLTKYANSQPGGSLSADFLELLLFGYPSPELEQFLTNDLTEKGLKKLANTTELSYTTIQNLVTKPLQASAVNLFYHLNSLRGLSRNTYFYKALLSQDAINDAIMKCGSFLMKCIEMQQVIDQCVNDMKVFWCWLCVAIVRLMEETISEEMSQNTQEDTIYLAEYLNNFDECVVENEDGTVIKKKFNLEKVGQYLENADLQQPIKTDTFHRWNKLLEENECLKSSSLIFPHDRNLSLIQQHKRFENAITELFVKPETTISENFALKSSITCGNIENSSAVHTSYLSIEYSKTDMIVVSVNEVDIIIMKLNTAEQLIRCTRLSLSPGVFTDWKLLLFENLSLVDLQFYDEAILSLLLQNSADGKVQSYFVQMPMEAIKERFSLHQIQETVDLTSLAVKHSILDVLDDNYLKQIEGVCTNIAVSGNRKIIAILSDNYKKVRVYEMEFDDDEDDVDLSQSHVLDTSKEFQV